MKILKKILYVEDDLDIQIIVNMALEDIGGYTLKICSTGQEALDAVEEFDPDLFLLDVKLPDMDGPCILKELRKNPKFDNIPAIFISASVQGDELIEFSDIGALGIIRKPFDPIGISKTINILYQNNRINTQKPIETPFG